VIASRHLALEHLLAVSGCAAAGSACRRVPVGAEEGAQFFGVELGFLDGAKCPPRAGSVTRTTFAVRSSQARGGRTTSPRNSEKPDGTSTRRACWAGGIAAFAWYMRIDGPIVAVSQ